MCFICGQPNFVRCNCVSTQPFCDQCAENSVCLDKLDSSCVIYHFGNPALPSRLINMQMPNGSSAQAIFERIDFLIGTSFNFPLIPVQTKTIHLTVSGLADHTLQADVNISNAVGNKIMILNDGLYVASSGETFKVKVDADAPPRYLADAVIGGTDGCVSITASDEGGILLLTPSISYECLLLNICSSPSLANELASCVVSNICGTGLSDTIANCVVGSICANIPIVTDLATCLLATGLISSGSTSVTADNGLNISTPSNVELGGTLNKITTIDQATFQLNLENGPVQIGDSTSALVNNLFHVVDNAGTYPTLAYFEKFGELDPAVSRVTSENFLKITQTAPYTGTTLGSHQDAVDAQFWLSSDFALTLQSAPQTSYAGIFATIIKSGTGSSTGNILTAGYFGGYLADSGNISDMAGIIVRGPQDPPPSFGGNFTGIVTNYYDIFLGDTAQVYGGTTITNRFAIYQQGTGDTNLFNGIVKMPNLTTASGTAIGVDGSGVVVKLSSSLKYKDNIINLDPTKVEKVFDLQGRNFNYKSDNIQTAGFIAEEVQAVGLTDTVIYAKDGTPDALNYNAIVAYLVETVKSLNTRIKVLEAK